MFPSRITKTQLSPIEAEGARNLTYLNLRKIAHNNSVGVVQPMSENSLSQVYKVKIDEKLFIYKRHGVKSYFRRETIGLILFSSIGLAPKVKHWGSDFLIMENFSQLWGCNNFHDLAKISSQLGLAHGYAVNYLNSHGPRFQNVHLTISEIAHRSDNVLKSIASDALAVLGPDYKPASIGDLKLDHIRRVGSKLAFIDFETFKWGGLEVIDLYEASRFLADRVGFDVSAKCVAEHYCKARCKMDPLWPVSSSRMQGWLSLVHSSSTQTVSLS